MKHTPGPWKIEYETDHDFLIVAPWSDAVKPGNTELFGDYRGGHVCNITFIDNASVPTERQALANAELIAQAPELKKRLEAAEARAAQAEAQRDTAWEELREIRRLIDADENESTLDEVMRKIYLLSKDAHDADQERNEARQKFNELRELSSELVNSLGYWMSAEEEPQECLKTEFALGNWLIKNEAIR